MQGHHDCPTATECTARPMLRLRRSGWSLRAESGGSPAGSLIGIFNVDCAAKLERGPRNGGHASTGTSGATGDEIASTIIGFRALRRSQHVSLPTTCCLKIPRGRAAAAGAEHTRCGCTRVGCATWGSLLFGALARSAAALPLGPTLEQHDEMTGKLSWATSEEPNVANILEAAEGREPVARLLHRPEQGRANCLLAQLATR
mmetsp:Transcript_66916/g.199081  ORF Transcript_66916/g.199081 Transcript_66916/m.199081 type:complete len:202 (+) Transcript_66916:588-1193(+)